MSSRYQKRKIERQTANIIRKAKIDMEHWFASLTSQPSHLEIEAFKAGYISGINRMSNSQED